MDIPNQRSSHQIPTPRGGGLAFVILFLIAVPFLEYQGYLKLSESVVLVGAGMLIAVIGFLDDLGHLGVRWRLLGHFLASGFAVYGLGGMPSLVICGWSITHSIILDGMAVMYLVWLLNLYNFMDGIDGIAGVETLSICLSAAGLYWLSGTFYLAYAPLILAAAVTGFLYWNTPPARIFMGDAGSGFLGLILGILSIQGAIVNSHFFWSWLILLGVFVVDATTTLMIRALQGIKVYEAHCTHAYQHASSEFGRHYPVTLAILMINIVWLCPIAVWVGLGYLNGLIGLLMAYFPLCMLAFMFKAGRGRPLS